MAQKLSTSFQNFLEEYKKLVALKHQEPITPIQVDDLASKIATTYEKIRQIIDWKEEHLIRRYAMERTIKRRMLSHISGFQEINQSQASKMAEPIVIEHIRNGYFNNNQIPQKKVVEVQGVLEKYLYILKNAHPTKISNSINLIKRVQYFSWILSIAACEIEEILDPPLYEISIMNFMTTEIFERIHLVPTDFFNDTEKFNQIFIATHRAVYELDPAIIAYHLLLGRYPAWKSEPQVIIPAISQNIEVVKQALENDLFHKKSGYFYEITEKYDTVYLIIGDILSKYHNDLDELDAIFESPKALKPLIEDVYNKRLSTLRSRLRKAAILSTLSIFLAGSVSLFLVEVPIAHIFYGKFSPLAVFIDILLPTLFMFILVSLIQLPSKKNLALVITEVNKVVFSQPDKDVYIIDLDKKHGLMKRLIFGAIFSIFGILTLSVVFFFFYIARIPWTSIFIDTINIAVIVFAAIMIRQKAKEMSIEGSSTFLEFILDMIAIPLAKVGQFFAQKWQDYNFLSVFFTALIDTPIVIFIKLIEDWRAFLKDIKSGIQKF